MIKLFKLQITSDKKLRKYDTKPRMPCNGNRILPHLRRGITLMGFVTSVTACTICKNTFSALFGISLCEN